MPVRLFIEITQHAVLPPGEWAYQTTPIQMYRENRRKTSARHRKNNYIEIKRAYESNI